MKPSVAILFLFLMTIVLIGISLLWYEDGKDKEQLLQEAYIREQSLEEDLGEAYITIGELDEDVEKGLAELDRSRDRITTLEGYIELRSGLPEIKTAYLTIDDGPSPLTGEILDILKDKNVPATFFVIGSDDEADRRTYMRILQDGHVLGNHTFSHDYSHLYSGSDEFWEDFYRQESLLKSVTGADIPFFRFPGGSNNPQPGIHGGGPDLINNLKEELADRGYIYFDWNVFPDDVHSPPRTAEDLTSRVKAQIRYRNNATILLHDHEQNSGTPQAVSMMIDLLRNEGYCFLPLSENTYPVQF